MEATDREIKDLIDRIRTTALRGALDTINKLDVIVCKSCMAVEDMKEYALLHEQLIKEVKTVTPLIKSTVTPTATPVVKTVTSKTTKPTLDDQGDGSTRECFWIMQKLSRKGFHCDKVSYWRPERCRWECTTHLAKVPKEPTTKAGTVQKQQKKQIPSSQLTPQEFAAQLKQGKITTGLKDNIRKPISEIQEDEETLTPNQVPEDEEDDDNEE